MLRRDQHRRSGPTLVEQHQRILAHAQKEIGAGLAAAPQLLAVGGIDADLVAGVAQRDDAVLQMGKGRIGQAADIDHVGAGRAIGCGAGEDARDIQRRRFDDLGEYPHIMARQIDRLALAARKIRADPSGHRGRG